MRTGPPGSDLNRSLPLIEQPAQHQAVSAARAFINRLGALSRQIV